jgi:hypothetical protein
MDHRQRIVALTADVRDRKVTLKLSTLKGIREETELMQRRAADFETIFDRKLDFEFRQVSSKKTRPMTQDALAQSAN